MLTYVAQYASQKGFCEDLDEGKFSIIVVHYMNTQMGDIRLREVMQQRREEGCLSMPLKQIVLRDLKASKSMEYTQNMLKQMETQIDCLIGRVESLTGRENWVMRLCMQTLSM